MKIPISNLLFTIAAFLNIGKLIAAGNRGTPHFEFDFMSHKIGLWVDDTKTRVTHADFQGNAVPQGNYYKDHNYLIRLVNACGLRFVAFIKQDGSLLGVEPLCPEKYPIHEPEPSETTWYVCYEKNYFKLTVDPVGETLMRMNILFQNLPHAGLTPEPVEVAGIRFFVFREANGRIVAGSLTSR